MVMTLKIARTYLKAIEVRVLKFFRLRNGWYLFFTEWFNDVSMEQAFRPLFSLSWGNKEVSWVLRGEVVLAWHGYCVENTASPFELSIPIPRNIAVIDVAIDESRIVASWRREEDKLLITWKVSMPKERQLTLGFRFWLTGDSAGPEDDGLGFYDGPVVGLILKKSQLRSLDSEGSSSLRGRRQCRHLERSNIVLKEPRIKFSRRIFTGYHLWSFLALIFGYTLFWLSISLDESLSKFSEWILAASLPGVAVVLTVSTLAFLGNVLSRLLDSPLDVLLWPPFRSEERLLRRRLVRDRKYYYVPCGESIFCEDDNNDPSSQLPTLIQ